FVFVNFIVSVNDSQKPDEPNTNGTSITCNFTVPETHLLPAPYTFGIWGLIYALLLGFIIYQWTEAADIATVEGIHYYFVIATILNISWLLIWVRNTFLFKVTS